MKKLSKIIGSLIALLVLTITFSVNATIKETPTENDGYDTIADDTIVIGITKFEPNVVVTALRVATASFNDAVFNYGKQEYSGVGIYYYTSGYWFKLDEENNPEMIPETDPMYDKLNNADIYYVNNVEKIIDVEYTREVSEGAELVYKTNNGKDITYENGVLHIPATVKEVDIYERKEGSPDRLVQVLLKLNENDDTFVQTTYVNLNSTIEAKTDTLINTYYNKYNNGDLLTEVNDEVFYVNLGKYLGTANPTSLTIGNDTYATDELHKMSIGNNAFTKTPIWKIVDGNVLVALPWLSVDAIPGRATEVIVGGQAFMVNIYATSTADNVLEVTRVGGLYGPAGYASEATFDGNTVDFHYTHGKQAVGVEISYGSEAITAAGQEMFLKDTNNNMAITETEDGYTFTLYFKYMETPVVTETEYQRTYKVAIPGKGAINLTLNGYAEAMSLDLSSLVQTKTNSVISTYYNQYSNGDLLTTVNDDVFYINLGEYKGTANPEVLTIADVSYPVSETANVGESRKMSIGNNAFTNVPVWKIVDGDLLVAVTWLAADALPNEATKVVIGTQTFRVNAYDTSTVDNTLVLTNVGSLYGPAGYSASAEFNENTVDYYYTHGTQAVGLTLSLNNEAITAANQVVFCKSADGNMAITTTEEGYTFVLYFHYENNPITAAAEYQRIYKIAIPGKGVTNLTLNGHAISQTIDLSGVIHTKSNALMETYYNKYNSGDVLTTVDDDIYYIDLGRYLGSANPQALTIGNESYDVSATANVGQSIVLGIGNNATINVPVWKIKDGNVLVALPWLCSGALPGQATLITLGGQQFAVNVYDTNIANNILSLTSAAGILGPSGYGTDVELSRNTVDFYYTHRTQALGLKLALGEEELTSANQIVFYEDINGNITVTTTTYGYTLAIYFDYADAPVEVAANTQKLYKIAIPGKGVISLTLNGHAISQNIDLSSSMATKTNALINTYYNQYTNGDLLTEVNDDVYYINLGRYLGTASPSSLTIGNESYEDGETLKLSIGNNAFVNVPVWKIKDGNVLVALTWLSADAMPNEATMVTIGGQTFSVTVYDTSTANNTLSITNAGGVYGPSGYETSVNVFKNTVDFYYTHGTQALGLTFSLNNEAITAANQVVLCKQTNGNMAITTTEAGYTFVIYFHYEENAITEAVDYQRSYKIAIPGKGVTNVALNGHAVTEIPQN